MYIFFNKGADLHYYVASHVFPMLGRNLKPRSHDACGLRRRLSYQACVWNTPGWLTARGWVGRQNSRSLMSHSFPSRSKAYEITVSIFVLFLFYIPWQWHAGGLNKRAVKNVWEFLSNGNRSILILIYIWYNWASNN